MKLYARQIPPEYQKSPIYLLKNEWESDDIWKGITVDGNDKRMGRKTDVYKTVRMNIEEAAAEVEDITKKTGYSTYKTITEAVIAFFNPLHKEKYNTFEIHQWKELLSKYQNCKRHEEDELECQALTLMTGKKYTYCCIRGCCQSDWNYIFYPTDYYTDKDIKMFEMEYFDTGTEWMVHDENFDPEDADAISGYTQYCYSWNDDDIRKELVGGSGVKPEDVVLYKFERYSQIPMYTMA